MANGQRTARRSGTFIVLGLLAGTAGCSDDFSRINGGLTTASLGLEASNQDRIIRKVGTERPGVKPAGLPEQAFPGRSLANAVAEPYEAPKSYAAPAVASDALPPLKPSKPQAAVEVANVDIPAEPVVKAAVPRRAVEKPKLAAAGIPVVPPAPAEPGRLRRMGEDITVGSVKPATKSYASRKSSLDLDAPGGGYTVVSGDTIYGIARRYGVTSQQLLDANGMTSADLRIGQRLAIPDASSAPKVVAARVAAPVRAARVAKARKAADVVTGSVPKQSKAPIATQPVRVSQPAPSATTKVAATAKAPAANFAWPARGRVIASYGQRTPGGTNKGVDIALPIGSPVKAAASGIVLYSGSELKDFGNLVLVRHDDGWVSAYANASENLVKRGDRVTRGQTIAKSGKSGNAAEPQLHFELRRNSKPVDPQRHLGS